MFIFGMISYVPYDMTKLILLIISSSFPAQQESSVQTPGHDTASSSRLEQHIKVVKV